MKILFENKQLNEGPGAGYTVSGTLSNVRVHKIESINKNNKNSDLVEYEIFVDASADFVNVNASSYYYSGSVRTTPVAIEAITAEFEDGEITPEDIKWAIESAKIEALLGGGWSHSTFDGHIEVDYRGIENAYNLNAIGFNLIDDRAIEYLDRAVQGDNTEESYTVVDEDDTWEASFESAQEAIEYAKKYNYPKVIHVIVREEEYEGYTEVTDEETVWEADNVEESLKESIEKKDGKTLSKDIQKAVIGLLRTSNTLFSEKNMPYATDDELVAIIDEFIKLKQRIIDMKSVDIMKNMSNGKLDEKLITEDFDDEERIQALANHLGIDPGEISNIYDYEYETPEGDYLVVDEDEAWDLARQDIENLVDDLGLESFTEGFRDWIIMNALETDWFEMAVDESMWAYAEDIKDEPDDVYDSRLIAEMIELGCIDEEDVEDPDFDAEWHMDDFVSCLVDNAGDPVEYCADNFGWDWVAEAAEENNLLDMELIVEECIAQDGVAHFIARYDGDEIELENGLYAYRTN